jgi:predicted polyphosphate/ATP-dependent NAD kinase
MRMRRVGFIVNPIAGMGGRVGLKGTDGVLEKAIQMGAKPVSGMRAKQALEPIARQEKESRRIYFYTCSGDMGERWLNEAGFKNDEYEVVYRCGVKTSVSDTLQACKLFLNLKSKGLELILFCGGDGTARDIYSVVEREIPILGIPSGVKMHSGVFGVTPGAISTLILDFISERGQISDGEIIDLDEDAYRRGDWKLRMYGIARTFSESTYLQTGKMLIEEVSDEEVKGEIAQHILEMMEKEKETLFLLGAGTTVEAVAKRLKIEKTLLGIDAVVNKKLIAKDLNEHGILDLLSKHNKAKLVISPIGAQGFIFGRGNLQITPEIIRKIGIENILIVSTPSKLLHTPVLRVDTGDETLDEELRKHHIFVINGYHSVCLRPVS